MQSGWSESRRSRGKCLAGVLWCPWWLAVRCEANGRSAAFVVGMENCGALRKLVIMQRHLTKLRKPPTTLPHDVAVLVAGTSSFNFWHVRLDLQSSTLRPSSTSVFITFQHVAHPPACGTCHLHRYEITTPYKTPRPFAYFPTSRRALPPPRAPGPRNQTSQRIRALSPATTRNCRQRSGFLSWCRLRRVSRLQGEQTSRV